MSVRSSGSYSSLPIQIILSVVVLVILTAGAVGVPAIVLVRDQLDRQARLLAEQGGRTTQALLEVYLRDLRNVAVLIVERPSLQALLKREDWISLTSYLETLVSGANLDGLGLCGLQGQQVISGTTLPVSVCSQDIGLGAVILDNDNPGAWLMAEQVVPAIDGWRVVVCIALDDDYVTTLRNESGLEQFLYVQGRPLVNSLGEPFPNMVLVDSLYSFQVGGVPYYGYRFRLSDTMLEVLAAQPVSDLIEARRQLTMWISVGMLTAALLGSLLGFWRVGALSRPLRQLRDAAERLRNGDLFSPIRASSRLREISQVGHALEEARAALQHSLLQLRQEKAWVDHILESVVEGILTLDHQGRMTYFSPGAEQITHYSADYVMGKRLDDLFPLADEKGKFSLLLPESGLLQKVTVLLPEGRELTLAITRGQLSPSETGRKGMVLVMRDVSDEDAIHRLLGDFLANITHEFRTPLAALDASTELMLDQLADLEKEDLHELLTSLRLGILGLATLIDNLLEGASIESGNFRVNPGSNDLSEIINQAISTMQPLIDKYQQHLVVEIAPSLPRVYADLRRTVQVIVNLLSNAIKWNPEGGQIALTVESSQGEVRVSLADQGPGIPYEQQANLFQRFVHTRNQEERTEYGAGIGLSVVKAIVEAQGGEIGVFCPNGGAVFWFTLQPVESIESP